jgi:PAS domain-containing protein
MAPLPEVDKAIIEERKLREYLLSPTHSIGRFKAAFFAQLGYTQEDWLRLEEDLRAQHLSREVEEVGASRHGKKYKIEAPLVGPNGKRVELISIWIIRRGEDRPRFVTAYPGG